MVGVPGRQIDNLQDRFLGCGNWTVRPRRVGKSLLFLLFLIPIFSVLDFSAVETRSNYWQNNRVHKSWTGKQFRSHWMIALSIHSYETTFKRLAFFIVQQRSRVLGWMW